MIKPRILRRLIETGVLAALFALTYRFPATSGRGYHEALFCLLFPVLLFKSVFRGRHLFWTFAALFLGLAMLFTWVPDTIAVKGGLPFALALLGTLLLVAWEALGLLAVAAFARFLGHRRGVWAAALGAAMAMLLWERFGFHVYTWSWGSALGGLPWVARSAAFVSTYGLSALVWGTAALSGAWLSERRSKPAIFAPLALLAGLVVLGGIWILLPREPQRELDIVMIQPNFDPGWRQPGMEAEMWRRSDGILKSQGLPRKETATLVLWPESSVMGRDDLAPNPRLAWEAKNRGVAWLFGTEGGLLNLVRGEAAGQAAFLQGKVEPMPFGERMPGPAWLREWLDAHLGFISQEPGVLTARSSFAFPTPQGPLKVHPIICSEALDAARVQRGLSTAGGELLTNHTNDGWFEKTIATDMHGVQIRLRAVEAGVPLLRATLTGKSGVFREDGTWALWGEPRSEAAHAFTLRWRPIRTPARHPALVYVLLAAFGSTLLALVLRRQRQSP